ncbi:3-hydroxybenzoate 4-monooxygenase, partial [Klebsiella pneumoniae]
DFPDIRMKSILKSSQGSVLIIPREGGYLTRIYIELDKLAPGERVADRAITVEKLIASAQAVFAPYSLDVREVAWWSVYEIGQRLT